MGGVRTTLLPRPASWRRTLIPAGLPIPPLEFCLGGQNSWEVCVLLPLSWRHCCQHQCPSLCSTVKVVLEDEMMSLLLASFKSVFFLPPKEELDICLYDMVRAG